MKTKALIAEFIATFTLVFIGVGAIAVNAMNEGDTGLLGIAFAHGLAIMVMVAATASISGGHINPAVTISLFCIRKIDLPNACGYIVAQCLGAITGAVFIKLCLPALDLAAVNMGTPSLGLGISPLMGLMTEIVLTFLLVFVICGVAVNPEGPRDAAPMAIGLTVGMDILVGGPISGAAMNPARHLGPALLGGGFDNVWIYWVGPVLGGLLAAFLFDNVLLKKTGQSMKSF